MSSFIVEDKVINSIVTYLFEHQNQAYPYNTRGKLNAISMELDTPASVGEEMYWLNLAAVEDRYGDYAAGTMGAFSGIDYHYRHVTASPVQVLKNLKCWLYQCSEGNCPETPLYKILDKFAGNLAIDIVRELPEYDAASWG